MRLALFLIVLIIAGGMAYIRLAPSDPARWNVDPPPYADAIAPGPEGVTTVPLGARARLAMPDASPEDLLARLDAIALATPRTTRLAGSPESGRITWITRSLIFGFPDYTTAQVSDAAIDLYARERFGRYDFGVNAARLRDWTGQLGP
ncbi:MAG TPA: DUF1499 domain-containing protein [Albidovulum sp.]|uniref:DUF1499 domain-containing protein n=1 Tax=Albidovulum sp. TaxID=1872424 RepID=UPI002B579AF6|nr:DUF1499 domain-containing protein [Albidovulum sp.]